MPVKINSLQLENVKRVKAVALEPSESGLTIIGGNNGQGKTSVLDAIAWALGGNKYKPSNPARDGSVVPPKMTVTLSNGLIVERKGENGTLKVTDPSGQKAGQALLDAFVEKLALDLPKFMEASDQEKAQTLLNIIGVGPQLTDLENQIKALYNERTAIGRMADQKAKYAKEMPFYPNVPETPVSAADLIRQQQDLLARNAQRQEWIRTYDDILAKQERVDAQIEDLKTRLRDLSAEKRELEEKAKAAQHSPGELAMESTEALEAAIANVEETNRKIRANLDREKAEEDAKMAITEYNNMTEAIDNLRDQKKSLLEGAKLPLPELMVEDGVLTYKGQRWDCISGSERLVVATAIVRALNPECGFVLMDKLEQMDMTTLRAFGAWLQAQGLQVIATRVSTGEECSVIIEDGYSLGAKPEPVVPEPTKDWRGGF